MAHRLIMHHGSPTGNYAAALLREPRLISWVTIAIPCGLVDPGEPSILTVSYEVHTLIAIMSRPT